MKQSKDYTQEQMKLLIKLLGSGISYSYYQHLKSLI